MNRSVITALVIAVAATAWILSGQIGATRPPERASGVAVEPAPAQVRVLRSAAQPYAAATVVTGRTEAVRRVEVRAETAGSVAEVLAAEGARVEAGQPIARIALKAREAKLAEAKALAAQRRIELDAAKTLAGKGWRTEPQVAAVQAQYDQAAAELKAIEVDIAETTIRAPFAGVLESRVAEVGHYLEVGGPVATIVDLDPILVVGNVNEAHVGGFAPGEPGRARLVTGEEIAGRIRYVASVADPATRTFRVELEVPNADGRIRDGLTAELLLPTRTARAHRVSPALLTLADDGRVGVKAVEDGRVRFIPVTVLGDAGGAVWLGGLPETVDLIAVGQEYVRDGQTVVATPVAMGS